MKSLQNRFASTVLIFGFLVAQTIPSMFVMPQIAHADEATESTAPADNVNNDVVDEPTSSDESVADTETTDTTSDEETVASDERNTEDTTVTEEVTDESAQQQDDDSDPVDEEHKEIISDTTVSDDSEESEVVDEVVDNTVGDEDSVTREDEVVSEDGNTKDVTPTQNEENSNENSSSSISAARVFSLAAASQNNQCFYSLTPDGNGTALSIEDSSVDTETTLATILANHGYGALDTAADQKGYETWKTASDKKVTLRVTLLSKQGYYAHSFGWYTAGQVATPATIGHTKFGQNQDGAEPTGLSSPFFAVGDSATIEIPANTEFGFVMSGYDTVDHTYGTFATEKSLNADNHADHAVVYEVQNGYVVAFEDGLSTDTGTDNDYNDLVLLVEVTDCTSVTVDQPKDISITINASKVVCTDPSDMPRWADYGPDITAQTAIDYVATHESCSLKSGWDFQWGYGQSDFYSWGVSSRGPGFYGKTATGTSRDQWKDFDTSTDSNGVAHVSITVPEDEVTSKIWVREALQPGYVDFAGSVRETDGLSAEMYCHTDVLNYDNFDFVSGLTDKTTYYCVAFNLPEDTGTHTDGVDLSVSKTASVATTTPYTPFSYTISVTNSGPETADNVVVTDILDTQLTLISATSTLGSFATSTGLWTVGTLTASSTASLTLTVSSQAVGVITNTATASSTGKTDNNSSNNSDTVTVTVESGMQCVVSDTNLVANGSFESPVVTHPGKWDIFPSGTSNWYALWNTHETVFNNIARPATPLFEIQKAGFSGDVNRTAYDGQQFVELDSDWDGPDGSVVSEPALITLYQDIETIPGAAYELQYAYAGRPESYVATGDNAMDVMVDDAVKATHTIASTTPGVLTWNTNSVAFVATGTTTRIAFVGKGPSNSTGMLLDAVSVIITACENHGGNDTGIDLSVSKTASVATTTVGTAFSYTIAVTNNGPETADGVEVTDVLPTGIDFVSATSTVGSYATSTGIWTVGTLAAHATETLTIDVTASSTGTIANTATATSTGDKTDNNTDNDSDTVDVTVDTDGGTGGGNSGIDLAVSKTASISEVTEVGTEFTYTITVTNAGPDVATGVAVDDTLPSSVDFVSATSTVGSYATSTGIWTVGDIIPNATETLHITVIVNSVAADIVNVATATSTDNQTDTNPDNDSGTHTVTVPDDTNGGGGSGGGGGGSSSGGGGTTNYVGTNTVAPQCEYLKEFLRYGYDNNPVEVTKLQAFLNAFEHEDLTVDGFFDLSTDAAVRRFQMKYFNDVLEPWGHTDSTGYVYILTKKKVNEIFCNRAFPVTQAEANEIVAFHAFLDSLRARGIDTTPFEGGIGGNPDEGNLAEGDVSNGSTTGAIRDFLSGLFGRNNDDENATSSPAGSDDNGSVTNALRNLAAAALVFPGDAGDAFGCLMVLIIILLIIYVLGTVIVNGMSENKPVDVVRRHKIIAFLIGTVIALAIAFLVPYPCLILPLIIVIILLIIWYTMRRSTDKPEPLQKEFSL